MICFVLPPPCYRRAIAEPESFDFGTAVVRRLEQAFLYFDSLKLPEAACTIDEWWCCPNYMYSVLSDVQKSVYLRDVI